MRHERRVRARARLAAVGAALAVAGGVGCGDDDTPADSTPVTIKFWRHDNASYKQADDDAFAEYRASHPNVTIDSTTQPWHVFTAALSGELKVDRFMYDLVLMPPAQVCTYAENLADVPADLVSLSDAQNTFFAPPLDASTCGPPGARRLKALPVEYNLEYGGVIVNLDKYQAKFPGKTPGWRDWASFLADASALSEFDAVGKPCVNGLDIDPDWPEPVRHIFLSQILQRGGDYWGGPTRDQFNFDTPQARAALADMVSWVVDHKVMSPALVPDRNTFVTMRLGRGATGFGCSPDHSQPLSVMGYAGTWALTAAIAERPQGSNTRFGFYPLPPMVGDQHLFVQNAGFAFAVPRTSQHQKVAWDIVKAIALNPAAMAKWARTAGTLPALRVNGNAAAAAAAPESDMAKVQPLLDRGQWMGYIPAAATADVLGAMTSNFFAVVKGQKTVEQALAAMQEQANKAIVQNR
jgi:multiple sugar transport system substrate-binding protein